VFAPSPTPATGSPGSLLDVLHTVDTLLANAAAGLDPEQLTADDSLTVAEVLGSIERHTTGLRVLAADAFPGDDTFAATADRSPERFLARVSGTSIGHAHALLAVGGSLADLPDIERALRAGDLSGAQVGALADAALADPTRHGELVDTARASTLHQLHKHADRIKAAAAGDDDARHARARRHRRLRFSNSADGCGLDLAGHGPATDGALLWQALRLFLEDLHAEQQDNDTRVPQEALAWDALIAMARTVLGQRSSPTAGGRGTKVIVRVDYESLRRRCTQGDEVSEIVGIGPIPVTAAEELIARGDVFLAAVITHGTKVVGVAHFGRRPNAFQLTALEWQNPTCANQRCNNTILDWDHEVDFDLTHHTTIDELDGLCPPCHRQKTTHGWRLVTGKGPRAFVPPGHPDHPGDPRQHRRPNTARPDPAQPDAA
jgi:5-methylcytosine-specific restriction endonuclease McrA